MVLDSFVEKWESEEGLEAFRVLSMTAVRYTKNYPRESPFPADSLIIGDNWFLFVRSEYIPCNINKKVEQNQDLRALIIMPKKSICTESKYPTFASIFEQYEDQIPNKEFALLPFSDGRIIEARNCFKRKEIHDEWYVTHYDANRIMVFPQAQSTYKTTPLVVASFVLKR